MTGALITNLVHVRNILFTNNGAAVNGPATFDFSYDGWWNKFIIVDGCGCQRLWAGKLPYLLLWPPYRNQPHWLCSARVWRPWLFSGDVRTLASSHPAGTESCPTPIRNNIQFSDQPRCQRLASAIAF